MTIRERGKGVLRRVTARDRLVRTERQVEGLGAKLAEHGKAHARQRRRLQALAERLGAQGSRLKTLEESDNATTVRFDVLQHQLAAIEQRLSEVEARLEPAPASTEDERLEARSLLEEMRQEHRRVRAEFGAVIAYEERIRRLESARDDRPS